MKGLERRIRPSATTQGIAQCRALPVFARCNDRDTLCPWHLGERVNPMELERVFEELRRIMHPYASKLDCKSDEDGDLYIDTHHVMKNRKPLFFGAVQSKKNYVSYHLMPVYVNPSLLDSVSPRLRKRMQGKSCFNFKSVDEGLFEELRALTKAGFEHFEQAGFITPRAEP